MSLLGSSIRPLLRNGVTFTRSVAAFSTSAHAFASSSTPSPAKPKPVKRPISSVPAGTVLKGLSILKDQPDPVALPDDQYPAWLWTILDEPKASASASASEGSLLSGAHRKGGREAGEEFGREKKRLRALNRANIKAANYLKTT